MSTTSQRASAQDSSPGADAGRDLDDVFAAHQADAPPSEGFLTSDDKHALVRNRTPFYIGAVELRDGNYGAEVVYTIYINPEAGAVPEPRKLSLASNPVREALARRINDKLAQVAKALGPVYLGAEGGGGGRSPRWELRQTPQQPEAVTSARIGSSRTSSDPVPF